MRLRYRHIWTSWAISGLLHAALVGGLMWITVRSVWPRHVAEIKTVVRPGGDWEEELLADTPQPLSTEADDTRPTAQGAEALTEVDSSDPGLSELARRQLEQTRRDVEQKPVAEQLTDLESLGRRLTNVSSKESVAAVTSAIAPLLGGEPARATQPDAGVDDSQPFDLDTAQISEVLRTESVGGYEYTAIMVDAAGRTQQTTLDDVDGKSLYDTFQLMLKFPLLETVYRKAVMGLLDRLIEDERDAPTLKETASPHETQDPATQKSQQYD